MMPIDVEAEVSGGGSGGGMADDAVGAGTCDGSDVDCTVNEAACDGDARDLRCDDLDLFTALLICDS